MNNPKFIAVASLLLLMMAILTYPRLSYPQDDNLWDEVEAYSLFELCDNHQTMLAEAQGHSKDDPEVSRLIDEACACSLNAVLDDYIYEMYQSHDWTERNAVIANATMRECRNEVDDFINYINNQQI